MSSPIPRAEKYKSCQESHLLFHFQLYRTEMHLAENATENLQLVGQTEKHYYELVHKYKQKAQQCIPIFVPGNKK